MCVCGFSGHCCHTVFIICHVLNNLTWNMAAGNTRHVKFYLTLSILDVYNSFVLEHTMFLGSRLRFLFLIQENEVVFQV